MANFKDYFDNETKLAETIQSSVSAVSDISTGWLVTDSGVEDSSSTSVNMVTKNSQPKKFNYTLARKPADSNGRAAWNTYYDTQRENVLYFDGLKAYAIAGPTNWNKGIGSAYTLCAWVYLASATGDNQSIIQADDSYGTYNREWQFHINANRTVRFLRFGVSNNVVQNLNTSTANVIPVGQWTHIAATFDNTIGSKIYINGQMVLSGTNKSTNGDGKSPVVIGARSHDNLQVAGVADDMLNGNIANAAIFTAGLTQDEVASIMNEASLIETNPNLLAYWKLDEGVGTTGADFTGNNDAAIYRIKIVPSADWQTDTELPNLISNQIANNEADNIKSGAYDFDGIDDYLTIPNDASICVMSAITISAYIKTTKVATSGLFIVESRDTSIDGYVLFVSNGFIALKINGITLVSTKFVSDGRWHHIHGTYDGSNIKLYVDGVLIATTAGSPTGISSTATVRIGFGSVSSASSYFDGQIGEVMIYSEALTSEPIWNHAAYSKYPDSTNLQGHWRLNGGVIDETSNNNDGTIVGLPLYIRDKELIPPVGYSMLGDEPNGFLVANFDGINDFVDVGATGATIKSISFNVRLTEATSESIMDFDGGTHTIVTDVIDELNANGFSTPTYYVDGISGAKVLTDDKLHHVVITTATGFSVSDFDIGRIATAYMGGTLCNVALFDYELSASEAVKIFDRGWVETNDTGLVSYYPFTGDYDDYKGSNNGTNSGSTFVRDLYRPMSVAHVPTQNLLDFDGSNDYVATTLGNVAVGDITSSAWVKTPRPYFRTGVISSKYDNAFGNQFGWLLYTNVDGYVAFDGRDAGYISSGLSTTKINDGQWHLCTGVRRGSVWEIWVDGVLENSFDSTRTGTIAVTTPHHIGNISTASSLEFNGYIKDVRVYDQALVTQDLQDLYNNINITTGLVSKWSLNEGTGLDLFDTYGSNDGVMIAGLTAPTWLRSPYPNTNEQSITLNSFTKTPAANYVARFTAVDGNRSIALDDVTLKIPSFIPSVTFF